MYSKKTSGWEKFNGKKKPQKFVFCTYAQAKAFKILTSSIKRKLQTYSRKVSKSGSQ